MASNDERSQKPDAETSYQEDEEQHYERSAEEIQVHPVCQIVEIGEDVKNRYISIASRPAISITSAISCCVICNLHNERSGPGGDRDRFDGVGRGRKKVHRRHQEGSEQRGG